MFYLGSKMLVKFKYYYMYINSLYYLFRKALKLRKHKLYVIENDTELNKL